MRTAPRIESTDPRAAVCYGEIYTYEDRYWAEVIVEEDGFTMVAEQSAEFDDSAVAVKWLAERGLFFAPSLAEKFLEALPLREVAGAALRAWEGLVGSRQFSLAH